MDRGKSLRDLNIGHTPTPVKKVATSSSVKTTISPPFKDATVSTKPLHFRSTTMSSPMEAFNHTGSRGVVTVSTSSSLNSIQTIKHEADVREEVLKQEEARLKIVAAEQDAQVQLAYVKTEEAKQKAQQELFRVQSLHNDEKEGIL